MIPSFEYVTMTQLGHLFGATSHEIGRWLVDIGLRTRSKLPSDRAIHGGYVTSIRTDGPFELISWHTVKTVAAIEAAGHRRVTPPVYGEQQPDPQPESVLEQADPQPEPFEHALHGPFRLGDLHHDTYPILDADNYMGIWVQGKGNAETVLRLLTLAHQFGKFGPK